MKSIGFIGERLCQVSLYITKFRALPKISHLTKVFPSYGKNTNLLLLAQEMIMETIFGQSVQGCYL